MPLPQSLQNPQSSSLELRANIMKTKKSQHRNPTSQYTRELKSLREFETLNFRFGAFIYMNKIKRWEGLNNQNQHQNNFTSSNN